MSFHAEHGSRRFGPVEVALIAFSLTGVSVFLWSGIGINLSDEGFLWYGVIRTLSGEVPGLDFQSYDPGRYYWSAAWMSFLGKGVVGLRISTAIFQAIGLTFGLLAAARCFKSWPSIVFTGAALLLWMHPYYNTFGPALALTSVFFAVRLLETPSLSRHFAAGALVGISAFFGRNYGVYAFFSFVLLIAFIRLRVEKNNPVKRYAMFFMGVLAGYSPMFFMFMAVPGFFENFMDSVFIIIKRGTTNLTLPVPWPWTIDYGAVFFLKGLQGFLTGFLFLLMPVFYVFSMVSVFSSSPQDVRRRLLFIASAFVGVSYMHYAFSRADLSHLALSMHPMILALAAMPYAFNLTGRKTVVYGLWAFLFLITFAVIFKATPYGRFLGHREKYVQYPVRGDTLWLDKDTAALIDAVKRIDAEKVGTSGALIIAPNWPAMYCILGRTSPVWEIYFLFPESEQRQLKAIEDIKRKNVNWAIIGDAALDGLNERRLRNTHPLIWQYLVDNFEQVKEEALPGAYRLLRRGMMPRSMGMMPRSMDMMPPTRKNPA